MDLHLAAVMTDSLTFLGVIAVFILFWIGVWRIILPPKKQPPAQVSESKKIQAGEEITISAVIYGSDCSLLWTKADLELLVAKFEKLCRRTQHHPGWAHANAYARKMRERYQEALQDKIADIESLASLTPEELQSKILVAHDRLEAITGDYIASLVSSDSIDSQRQSYEFNQIAFADLYDAMEMQSQTHKE